MATTPLHIVAYWNVWLSHSAGYPLRLCSEMSQESKEVNRIE
eukprot:CAMPEP_0173396580 /NCGR_PEP_ID=MMETSP1356-20130122/35897_1 /TAXON_ID=77927 ORGANISM="Hemiselmis virescens, Strain PCC157" /NCGR_SAMPLE_ID=MMETSP1356 /ASSEMBLY_ACC=CAM_ASM_000847 /LENGTH=41 /DNA_ID= /DNA_START= /DNA_END= /DNA_ORIENTATION=